MREFERLVAWQRPRVLCRVVHRVAGAGDFSRHLGLRGQICGASISVMSNIAEGFGRYSLYIALDLGFLDESRHAELEGLCRDVDGLLARLRRSLD